MSPDPNKKVLRQFQCRESLWQRFEQMAKELECSVDYLINDSMKQYARQRGYAGGASSQRGDATSSASNSIGPSAPYAAETDSPLSTTSGSGAHGTSAAAAAAASHHGSGAHPMPGHAQAHQFAAPSTSTSGSGAHGIAAAPQVAAPRYGAAPPMPVALGAQPSAHGPVVAPPPASGRAAQHVVPPAPPAPGAKRVGPPPMPAPAPGALNVSRVPAPPPLPTAQSRTYSGAQMPAVVPAVVTPRQLQIRYQGQSFPVTKDKFIIGRGKQSSDLTIKDPNVSRQHAMIEFDGNQYSIVDLGSTNGLEFQGQRVRRKVLADGDVVRICDHELAFHYR
jgi:neural Wiskott-Aldrich syndrome protein